MDTREIHESRRNVGRDVARIGFATAMLPFRPLMGLATLVLGGGSKETQEVYLIRVQDAGGGVQVARIEKNIGGATLDMGDYVSIWGFSRGGVCVVRRAFNHSVGAEVKLR